MMRELAGPAGEEGHEWNDSLAVVSLKNASSTWSMPNSAASAALVAD